MADQSRGLGSLSARDFYDLTVLGRRRYGQCSWYVLDRAQSISIGMRLRCRTRDFSLDPKVRSGFFLLDHSRTAARDVASFEAKTYKCAVTDVISRYSIGRRRMLEKAFVSEEFDAMINLFLLVNRSSNRVIWSLMDMCAAHDLGERMLY